MGIGRRFCSEFSRPFFGLKEEPFGTLDMPKNFSVGKGFLSIISLLKFCMFGFAIASLGIAFHRRPEPAFYPAYLTPWGVVYCILYLGGSLILATCSAYSPHRWCNFILKFTWVLFSIAAVQGICIALLYWFFVWHPDRGIYIDNVMTHGGCLIMVLIDGLIINRIPLRIKHMLLTTLLAALYLTWSVIQNVVWRYNPVHDDDDDALYDVMKWREETTSAIILIAIILLGAIPLLTSLLWFVSLPGRHYENDVPANDGNKSSTDDEELGADDVQVNG
jgi:MFS family permease